MKTTSRLLPSSFLSCLHFFCLSRCVLVCIAWSELNIAINVRVLNGVPHMNTQTYTYSRTYACTMHYRDSRLDDHKTSSICICDQLCCIYKKIVLVHIVDTTNHFEWMVTIFIILYIYKWNDTQDTHKVEHVANMWGENGNETRC